MGLQQKSLSRDAIFRAVKDQVGGSLGRTLAECLYWSQYAQRVESGMPAVWKTGAELGKELGCKGRTANEHLKKLEYLGFWELLYQPRPGHPSKVTWLLFTEHSLKFLALARSLRDERVQPGKRAAKHTVGTGKCAPSSDTITDPQQSVSVTSKHCETSQETSWGHATSFLLTKEQKAVAGKKEPFQKISTGSQEDVILKAPKYVKASADDLALAMTVRDMLEKRELKQWDWSSRYTWEHVSELRRKLNKAGVITSDEWSDFLLKMFDNWGWLRTCMEYRYSSHEGNLHRPTPMALAAETAVLHSALAKKFAPPPTDGPTMTNMDQPF